MEPIYSHRCNITVKTWHGHRPIAIDGSTAHVPDTAENVKHFGGWDSAKSEPGDICPKARLSFAYDPLNKIILDAIMSPTSTGEDTLARQHLSKLSAGDLTLMDRGYASYRMFRLHEESELFYCARIPTDLFTKLCDDFLESEEEDRIVMYEPQGLSRTVCKNEGLPVAPLNIRLIKIVLPTGEVEVLATNIFDKRISVKSFGELYHLRWAVEEEYKRLKSRVELEDFSGKKKEYVFQDFYADIVRLNLSAISAVEAREELINHGKKKKFHHAPNMSFALSHLCILLNALFEPSTNKLTIVLKNLTGHLIKNSEPIRPGRSYPRKNKPVRSGYSAQYKRAS